LASYDVAVYLPVSAQYDHLLTNSGVVFDVILPHSCTLATL